jgi:hypothetical protein
MRRLPHIGSDHFPFYAALSFEPEEEASQEKPDAPSPEEQEEADDMRKEAFVP